MSTKDKRTAIALYVLFAIAIVASGFWIADHATVASHAERIDVIEELYQRSSDRWTGSDMRTWTEELKRLNPDLRLPAIPDK